MAPIYINFSPLLPSPFSLIQSFPFTSLHPLPVCKRFSEEFFDRNKRFHPSLFLNCSHSPSVQKIQEREGGKIYKYRTSYPFQLVYTNALHIGSCHQICTQTTPSKDASSYPSPSLPERTCILLLPLPEALFKQAPRLLVLPLETRHQGCP